MAQTYNFLKKDTLTQVFSFEFYKISKNIFFLQNTFGQMRLKQVDSVLSERLVSMERQC